MSQLVVPDVPVPDEAADQVAECGDPIRRLTPIRTRSKGSFPELPHVQPRILEYCFSSRDTQSS